MSGDTLTYDMAMMSEGSPQVFVKRDWLTLQDQQNGNYGGNQLVLDTSQLANSNKYADYRNAYLTVPMVMAISSPSIGAAGDTLGDSMLTDGGDFKNGVSQVPSLKNWFGSIVSSMLLDYAGTTIIQNTPLCGLFSTFTLMTSLSRSDIETLGPTIGFYPDSVNFRYETGASSQSGHGSCNNSKVIAQGALDKRAGGSEFSNPGIQQRWSRMMIDPAATSGQGAVTFDSIVGEQKMNELYRSRVIHYSKKADDTDGVIGGQNAFVIFQIQAFIYLRHLHSFFSQIPLLKGVFFRLTLNLNQPVVTLESVTNNTMKIKNIISPLGGVSPIMIASQDAGSCAIGPAGQSGQKSWGLFLGDSTNVPKEMRVTLNVGTSIIDTTQNAACGQKTTSLNRSCFLNVPLFTFNPAFESAYLSRPTKTIVYSDLYQYTTPEVTSAQFNYLITNGISNIKSVLVLPMESKIGGGDNLDYPPFWSPFDTCGGGTTAPLGGSSLTNFNIVVAGQNMVYNQVSRSHEEFNNQLYGVNAVNAGLTDGLTSGLVDYWSFLQHYGYYYVNCARQLPIDEAVPKSVFIQGTTQSSKALKLYVFIEYGVQVNVDVLTGARV